MTVTTAYSPLTYNGNGSVTSFSVTWPFFLSSHLVVTHISDTGVETVLTLTSHYTVSGGRDATTGLPGTGTVTTVYTYPAGQKIRITRVTPKTQQQSITSAGSFAAKTIEAMIDRVHMIAEEGGVGSASDVDGAALRLETAGAEDYWDGENYVARGFADGTEDTDLATVGQVNEIISSGGIFALKSDLAAGDGSSTIGYTGRGADAEATTLQDKLRQRVAMLDYVPKSLHAAIFNGTDATNLLPYLQKAIDEAALLGAASYLGATVEFPYGRTRIAGTAVMPGTAFVSLAGNGKGTVLDWRGGNDLPMISFDDGSDESKVSIERITFTNSIGATGVIGIQTCVTPGNFLVNLTVRDNLFVGLHTTLDTWTETDQIVYENNYVLGYTYGIRSRGGTCSNFYIKNNHFRAGVAGSWAVEHAGGWNIVIDGNCVQSDVLGAKAFKLTGINTFCVQNTYYEVIGTPDATNSGTFVSATNSRNGYIGQNITVGASALYASASIYCNCVFDGTSRDIEIGPNTHLASNVSGTIQYFAEAAGTTTGIYANGPQSFIADGAIESAYSAASFLGPVRPHITVDVPATWTAYTPTVSAGSGSFTNTATSGRYWKSGKTVAFQAKLVIGAAGLGTAGANIRLTVPVAAAHSNAFAATTDVAGEVLPIYAALTDADPTKIYLFKMDGTFPGADSRTIIVSGTYEAA